MNHTSEASGATSEPVRSISPGLRDDIMDVIKKGQQLAGHIPNAEALDRAQRVLDGTTSIENARAEFDAKYANG